MKLPVAATAALAALALILTACGDEDDEAATDTSTTASAPAPAAEDTTTTTDPETDPDADEAAPEGIEGADAEAVADAVAVAFDSTVAFEGKVAFLEGGESLRASHDAYVAAAQQVGGIAVEATGVAVAGDAAEVTYRVLFAGTEAYGDLTMAAARIGGAWVIPTDEFCGFLASARTPCA